METLILAIQNCTTEAADVIALEQLMSQYLDTLETNKHHLAAGWSRKLRRWHSDMSYTQLQQRYWKLHAQTNNLKIELQKKRKEREEECEHVWERDWADRDERSRYMCAKCGKGR